MSISRMTVDRAIGHDADYSCHVVEVSEYWEYEPHLHVDCCDLAFVYRGRLEQQVNDSRATLLEGDMALVRPGDSHRLRSRGVVMYTLNFAPDSLQRAGAYLGLADQTDELLTARTAPVLRTQAGDRAMLLAQYQQLLYSQTEPTSRLAFDAFLVRWLVEVVSTAELSSFESLPSWLARLLEFIDENVEAPVTVSELSRVSGRSAEHIARCFRSFLNTTPSRTINQARINRAALLLAHTNRSILDICYSLGYNSASYFYRLFRASFGVAPDQYRRRHSVYHASGDAAG